MIDFQGISSCHMSHDFWYFLYTSTDSQWRKDNLENCFSTYYETLKQYMGSTFPDMTLTGLKEEFQSTRFFSGVSIGAGFNLPTTLSPYQLKEQELKKFFEKRRQELGSP